MKRKQARAGKPFKVALLGNPNSGKSTLFNALTGLNQHTGNYPGVTVDKITGEAILQDDKSGAPLTAYILDLPGTYSLYPKTLDEEVCYNVICDDKNPDCPDAAIIVADATNLRRSLFLATQVLDLGIPSVLVLNMIDFAKAKGLHIDEEKLSRALGIPVLFTNARKKTGIEALKKILASGLRPPGKTLIDVKKFIEPALLDEVRLMFPSKTGYGLYQAVNNQAGISHFKTEPQKADKIKELIKSYHYEKHKVQTAMTIERYKFINDIVRDCVSVNEEEKRKSLSARIDRALTHRVWGYFIFLLILFLIFQSIFFIAPYPMKAIEFLFVKISEAGRNYLPPGELTSLLINGILAGLSGVVVFIPQIALLFAFIAILEDTGYMARVSFLMDKLMRPVGLNGRSVIPLMSGVACAVPAILGTRVIPGRKERLITILVTPFMSCSARLPVYTLLISLVIPATHTYGYFNLQGIALMALYLLGFIAAISVAAILKFFIRVKEKSYFVMEMPLYHLPKLSVIGVSIYQKVKVFLLEAGKIIVIISIILWFMASHSMPGVFSRIEKQYNNRDTVQKYTPAQLNAIVGSDKLKSSFAGKAGRVIEPVIKPLGFDWKIGIALITSFAAREVFVGTMATLYSADSQDNTMSIRQKMAAATDPHTGKKEYTAATGISLMLFYAFAMQCMSTLAVVYHETKKLKWPIIQFAFMGALAWLASFVAYHIIK